MKHRRFGKPAGMLAVFLLTAILIGGCAAFLFQGAEQEPGTFNIDPVVRDYYRELGKDWLGPAISPLVTINNAACQYTVSALVCAKAEGSSANRHFLAKLGTQVGLAGIPMNVIPTIYPDFIPVLDVLGGLNVTGNPLSEPVYNYQDLRVEQYFESIAFYHNFNDPPGTVGVLPLGASFCGETCSYQPTISISFSKFRAAEAFRQHYAGIAWARIAGRALTDAYTTSDGREIEQVFENVVAYAPIDEPGEIRLRNLPILLNMTTTPPKSVDPDPRVVFYPLQGDLGFPVPVQFDRFIQTHGGTDLSGAPIAETLRYAANDGVPRQCFQNYCLDFHSTLDDRFQTRPAPLGFEYMRKLDLAAIKPITTSDANVIIQTSETFPQVSMEARQVIRVLVHKRSTMTPYPGIVPLLEIFTPDDQSYRFIMSTTDETGRSEITLPVLPYLYPGMVVGYQVCVRSDLGHESCELDGYLVWN